MKPEELLRPRYKVIADYPNREESFALGEIIELKFFDGEEWMTDLHYQCESYFEQYPDIFRKLEWWEHRKEEDMPEYVKVPKRNSIVYKVSEWSHISNTDDFFKEHLFATLIGYRPDYSKNKDAKLEVGWLIPATKEEYEQQQLKPTEV